MNDRYIRRIDEDDITYGLRLIEIKKTERPDDLDWSDIVELLGLDLNKDSLRKSQDTMFGGLSIANYFKNKNLENNTPKTQLQAVREKVGELDILKRQIQVEKNELTKIKREFIKSISIAEDLKQYMKENNFKVEIPEYCYKPVEINGEYVMIIHITDWHIGYVINDCKGNYFNWKIANERIDKLIQECYKYIELYGITKVYVFNSGDMVEHTYMRKNQSQFCEFNQMEQINKVIKLIYRFIVALNKYCEVEYDSIYGNHDRANGDKTANLDGDNTEVVVREQLQEYINISGNKRIKICNRKHTDKEIIKEINGLKCKFIHGENKSNDGKQLIKNEISMDNEFYDLIFKGHLHNFKIESENNGRYIISTGCLSGYNDYSVNFGCTSIASQTIAVIGNGEIELIKDVKLA